MKKQLEYLINEIQENYKDQDLLELRLSLEKAHLHSKIVILIHFML